MDPYNPAPAPSGGAALPPPPPGMSTVITNPGPGLPVERKTVGTEFLPKVLDGISPWTSSSWVSSWMTKFLGAIVAIIAVFGWAQPEWLTNLVGDPEQLATAIATIAGLVFAILGWIGQKGRENDGAAASKIVKVLPFFVVAGLLALAPAAQADTLWHWSGGKHVIAAWVDQSGLRIVACPNRIDPAVVGHRITSITRDTYSSPTEAAVLLIAPDGSEVREGHVLQASGYSCRVHGSLPPGGVTVARFTAEAP